MLEGPTEMKPVILAVSADSEAAALLERDLPARYAHDYGVLVERSPAAALDRLRHMQRMGVNVALMIADRCIGEVNGIDFLIDAHEICPNSRRLVLIAFDDPGSTAALMRATTLGQIDAFVNKPWASPEEFLYVAIGELLSEWAQGHLPRFEWVQIVGPQWSPDTHLLRDLLQRNPVPYGFYPDDSEDGRRLMREFQLEPEWLPATILHDGRVLRRPTPAELATALGVWTKPPKQSFDVVIVGAGPAGLAAAVYGASEGLDTMLLEHEAVGGQAGTSSKIRNYLGFPRGISGHDLAVRAFRQSLLFGAQTVFMNSATGIRAGGNKQIITRTDDFEIESRAVVIATGVTYRQLQVPGIESLTGRGVYYGAAVSEAPAMVGQPVFVAGAGNSAGQAAIHLAKYACLATILVRGNSLAKSMSDYLIQEIAGTPNIDIRLNTQILEAHGNDRLRALDLTDNATRTTETLPAAALFVLIGAEPHTDWLPESIARDEHGFILTGRDLLRDEQIPEGWPLARPPYLLETSIPGVFAVGDVRHRSMKRVASAVGEGSTAISLIHEYLEESAHPSPTSTASSGPNV